MEKTEKTIEKRKNKRFQVKDGAYTILSYNPTIMGQIINVSKDGLAVRYTGKRKLLSDSNEIDMFRSNVGFYLEKIPVKTILEYKISGKLPFSPKKKWQRQVQFIDLTNDQMVQIDHFLQNYTSMITRSDNDRRQCKDPQSSGPERRSGVARRNRKA